MAESGLPSTFVPRAQPAVLHLRRRPSATGAGLRHIVGGMCETDYSGYPDCRDDTIKALQVALSLGMDQRVVLHTPLMWRDKAETWRLAERLGGEALVRLIVQHTHSCYLGDRNHRHDWGLWLRQLARRASYAPRGWQRYRAGSNRTTRA